MSLEQKLEQRYVHTSGIKSFRTRTSDVIINDSFKDDMTYYEETRKPVLVEYINRRHIKIYPTGSTYFPSGKEYWHHDNNSFKILGNVFENNDFDEDLFKL